MKTARSSIIVAIVLLSSLISSCNKEDLPPRLLVSNSPASMFEEAYPLGNGRIGAMVYGGPHEERIMLNEETLWAGGPVDPYMNPEAHLHLQSVRDALFTADYELADKLVRNMQGAYSQSYAPLGDLNLSFEQDDSIKNYSRELDIRRGISSVRYSLGEAEVCRETFVSYPDQVMVISLRASGGKLPSFRMHASSKLPHKTQSSGHQISMHGIAPSHAEPNYRGDTPDALKYEIDNCMRFSMTASLEETDGIISHEKEGMVISDASEVVILVSLGTSFNGYDRNPGKNGADEEKVCMEYLEKASNHSYLQLKDRHVSEFSEIFNRLTFSLGTEATVNSSTRERLRSYAEGSNDQDLIALYFQYGRYLLMSSSRPGGIPANLQGIWNEHLRPPWSSNYTTNINAEMNYWPAEVCNLSEMHDPLIKFIGRLAKTGAITARTYYDCDGWCCHHNTDIWAMTNPVGDFGRGHPVWANWNMGGTWLSTHLWEHYLYTLDTSYLTEYAYPLMKGAATFCLDFLTEAGDGYMVTAPNTSPENMYINDDAYSGSCLYGPTADMAMIRELFLDVMVATNITGDQVMRKEVKEMFQRLPPYKIGRKGNLQEWYYDWEDRDPKHRHVSHLFALFPGNTIHPDLNPELAEACRKSLEIRTNNGTGWSIAWKISLWARLQDGEMALDAINKLLHLDENTDDVEYHGGGTYPNLMDAHPPYQIDGNFGGTAGIAEMLMQSKLHEITLLPALPVSWSEGDIKGLRARGAYSVNILWRDGKLIKASVIPDFDGTFKVNYGAQSKEFEGRQGEEVIVKF